MARRKYISTPIVSFLLPDASYEGEEKEVVERSGPVGVGDPQYFNICRSSENPRLVWNRWATKRHKDN